MHAPRLRHRSGGDIDDDCCLEWQAQLLMTAAEVDEVDDIEICVAVAEFVTVQVSDPSFSTELLDWYSGATEVFCPIFTGTSVAEEVQDQFGAEPVNNALLILSTQVLDPLGGNELDAWMVAQLIHRMLPSHDGLALFCPSPTDLPAEPIQQLEALENLSMYWRNTVGFEAITDHPGMLGQSTAYVHLQDARAALGKPGPIPVPVTGLERSPELPLYD